MTVKDEPRSVVADVWVDVEADEDPPEPSEKVLLGESWMDIVAEAIVGRSMLPDRGDGRFLKSAEKLEDGEDMQSGRKDAVGGGG